jgi:hypothetical protein
MHTHACAWQSTLKRGRSRGVRLYCRERITLSDFPEFFRPAARERFPRMIANGPSYRPLPHWPKDDSTN